MNVWASSPWRSWTMSSSSLLEKIVSIREGSSCRANNRLTKRLQAEVLGFRGMDGSETMSIRCKIGGGGLQTYRLRIQRLWRFHSDHKNRRGLSGGHLHPHRMANVQAWHAERAGHANHTGISFGSAPTYSTAQEICRRSNRSFSHLSMNSRARDQSKRTNWGHLVARYLPGPLEVRNVGAMVFGHPNMRLDRLYRGLFCWSSIPGEIPTSGE